uniref:Putative secreted protein n=1 Tax=Ixodes ricinus TaxID=34613 RepID=A0A6B0UBY0_IXORI
MRCIPSQILRSPYWGLVFLTLSIISGLSDAVAFSSVMEAFTGAVELVSFRVWQASWGSSRASSEISCTAVSKRLNLCRSAANFEILL